MLCLFATEGILFAYLIFSYAYLGSQGYQAWPPTGGPPSLTLAIPATILLVGIELRARMGQAGAPALAQRRRARLASGLIAS